VTGGSAFWLRLAARIRSAPTAWRLGTQRKRLHGGAQNKNDIRIPKEDDYICTGRASLDSSRFLAGSCIGKANLSRQAGLETRSRALNKFLSASL
jgi:hypothetical protein